MLEAMNAFTSVNLSASGDRILPNLPVILMVLPGRSKILNCMERCWYFDVPPCYKYKWVVVQKLFNLVGDQQYNFSSIY